MVGGDILHKLTKSIKVFETREEIEKESYPRKLVAPVETVCMTPAEYHGLITAIILLMILLFSITLVAGLGYRYDVFNGLEISANWRLLQTLLEIHLEEPTRGPTLADPLARTLPFLHTHP